MIGDQAYAALPFDDCSDIRSCHGMRECCLDEDDLRKRTG